MLAQITNNPDVGQAVGQLLHAVAPNLNAQQVTEIVVAVVALSRIAQRYFFKGQGAIGKILDHTSMQLPASAPKVTVETTQPPTKTL